MDEVEASTNTSSGPRETAHPVHILVQSRRMVPGAVTPSERPAQARCVPSGPGARLRSVGMMLVRVMLGRLRQVEPDSRQADDG